MTSNITFSLIAIIVLALSFDFINGFHDTANAIATSVTTRVLTPTIAIAMAAILNFIGAMISKNVAKTISSGILSGDVAQYIIISALIAAIIWNLFTWKIAMPSSSSHALIGAMVGAGIADTFSFNNVLWGGVFQKVILPLITSPIMGFIISYLFMNLLFEMLRPVAHAIINKWFSKLQIVSAAFMAFSHGSNDAQKSMGIITLALISAGFLEKSANVPVWVSFLCALAMAMGTSIGGWRIIKTIGQNMIKLEPIGGFAAETSSAIVIEIASRLGMPVSTTHIISSSIMGVGAAKRLSSVRWAVVRNMVWAWIFTLPITALLGFIIVLVIKIIMRF